MKKAKLILVAMIVTLLVIAQFAMVSAAPSLDEADISSQARSTRSLSSQMKVRPSWRSS